MRWTLGTLASSFLVATFASIICAFFIVPMSGHSPLVPAAGETKHPPPTPSAQHVTLSTSQARTIIDRNIFSSEGNTSENAEAGQAEAEKNKSNRAVESKLQIALRGVIFGGDPLNGLALIENLEKHTINSFIAGDIIISKVKLLEIYPEHIILDNDGRREYKKLDVKQPEKSRRGKKKVPGIEEVPGIAPIATGPVPENFKEAGFERTGHNIAVSEDYKRSLLGPQMTKVLQDAKAEPNMVGGQLKGFRMTRIREDSIYQKSGLMNGDIVHEINGVPLNDASGAIRLLNQLRNEKEIEVRIERGGSFFNVTLSIQ